MYAITKVMDNAEIKESSLSRTQDMLQQLGEKPLRSFGDVQLNKDLETMNALLEQTSDSTILNMPETNERRILPLMKIYLHLAHLFHFRSPEMIAAASLRMIEITLR